MVHQRSGQTGAPGKAEATAKLLEVVERLATELHPHLKTAGPAALDSSLDRDLAFDSLGRVQLLARIEQAFDVVLPERVLVTADSPRDLLREVLRARGVSAASVAPEVREKVELGLAEPAPESAETLVDVLDWHVRAHPDRPHIQLYSDVGEGEVITYGALRQGAERVAAGLQRLDLQPGESVAIMLATGPDYFVTFYGVLLAGGVPVPIYPPARVTQIEEHLRRHVSIVSNCLAGILVTLAEAKPLAQLLRSQVETLRHVVTVEEVCTRAAAFSGPALHAQDTAFLQYTSGSTGTPKGVVLSHGNLLANIRALGEAVQVQPSDVFVSWLPLYHDLGLIGAWLASLYHSLMLVVMSPLAMLARPQRWLWAIHRYHGTLSGGPNFAYELCLRAIKDEDIAGLDLSSWRVAFNGAESVSPDTVARFCERFAKYGFRREAMAPAYGLAECTVGLAFPPLGRGPLIDRIERAPFQRDGRAIPAAEGAGNVRRFVACGLPLRGHDIRIVDSAGRELPEREQGRLQFRGPSATSGYFRNPEETRALFHDDWLDSGDRAYIADGEVYITGRTKDIIIRAGRNIYPDELERAVGAIAGIREGSVAVFGGADPETGTERLVVLAETEIEDPQTLDQLRARINAVATELIGQPPDDVVFAPPNSVLKTPSGKVRRGATREVFERGLLGKPRRTVWLQVTRLALAAVVPQLRRALRAVSALLYGGYVWILFGLLGVPVWLTVAVLPRPSWRWSVIRGGIRCLARASGTPLTVHGLENLPPRGQPCVFVANHASHLDGYVLAATLPRELGFVAKVELTESLITRVLLSRMNTEFVDRFDKEAGIAGARRVIQSAVAGRSLVFFAEGTFIRTPGLLPFHMGAFVAAVDAGIPVVPVAISGTRSILRSESWLPRRGAITVTIDKPIDPKTVEAADSWEAALKLREATRSRILRHCGEPDLEHVRPPIWAP
ncbi:MAG: AMP-binding protein [Alphaproteobacteria bacterium]